MYTLSHIIIVTRSISVHSHKNFTWLWLSARRQLLLSVRQCLRPSVDRLLSVVTAEPDLEHGWMQSSAAISGLFILTYCVEWDVKLYSLSPLDSVRNRRIIPFLISLNSSHFHNSGRGYSQLPLHSSPLHSIYLPSYDFPLFCFPQ